MSEPKGMILKCVAGSHLYGLNTPSSDMDMRGIFMESAEDVLNVEGRQNGEVADERQDEKYYSLGKFLKLASECNPNIVEMLYLPGDAVLFKTPLYDDLVSNRGWFMSKRARHTFSGYAYAQIQRAKGLSKKGNEVSRRVDEDGLRFAWSVVHSSPEIRRRAFDGPLCSVPDDFGTEDVERLTCRDFMRYLEKLSFQETDLSAAGYEAFLKMRCRKQTDFMYCYDVYGKSMKKHPLFGPGTHGFYSPVGCFGYCAEEVEGVPGLYAVRYRGGNDSFIAADLSGIVATEAQPGDRGVRALARFDRDAYEKEHREYLSFWEWMANRNEARYTKDWDSGCQVDWKNMMHTMRLLMCAMAIAKTGEPKVRFAGEERDYLMSIRRGEHPYQEVLDRATAMMEGLEEAFEKSSLPHGSDIRAINGWYRDVMLENWRTLRVGRC